MKRCRIKHPKFIQQQGVALMVMMIILILGTAGFLVSSLGGISQTIKRDQKTTEALSQAKEALIAYAATQGDLTGDIPRPGDFPCPDTTNDGAAEGSCVAGAIGRLPHKTLGIPQLFDSSGESLWYSISGNFRSLTGTVLNSDTNGTLNVYANDGTTLLTSSSNQAVAVIFAPGAILNAQQRATAAQQNIASNYLEAGLNGRNNATTNGPFVAGDSTSTFNDKLIYINASQLRPAIEKRVAGELRKFLESYYTAWNAFPFAVSFSNPSTATFVGTSGTSSGLVPLDTLLGGSANQPAWNATPNIVFSDGATRLYCVLRYSGWTDSAWRCCTTDTSCSSTSNVTIPAGVTVTITGRLNDVGKGFWKPFDINDNVNLQVRARNSSGTSVLATSLLDNVSVSGILDHSDGSARVVFSGRGKTGGTILRRIELRTIASYASSFPNWFSQNNWEQVMYYATSPGYAPGGVHTCTPYCLSVNGKVASAVMVATSGALTGQTHPSGTLSNYLEGANLAHTSGVYETKTISDTFNDTIVTVTP